MALLIGFLILVAPLFLIAFDLWAGIRKAKQRGEAITSQGWKRTVFKIGKYYNMLLALATLDVLQVASFWYLDVYDKWSMPLFPWLTMLGAFLVGIVEVKSILEPATSKEKREITDVANLAAAIASHRTDPQEMADAIASYLRGDHSATVGEKKGGGA